MRTMGCEVVRGGALHAACGSASQKKSCTPDVYYAVICLLMRWSSAPPCLKTWATQLLCPSVTLLLCPSGTLVWSVSDYG